MLETHSLEFFYGESARFVFPDVRCAPGDTLLILGNSGSGKTTLLNLMALLLSPEKGEIRINGTLTTGLPLHELPGFRARNIGLVFQKPYFVNALNVRDNLLMANYFAGNPPDKPRVNHLAESLGFSGLLDKRVTELSGGEQQRVGIARALMNSAKLILADEPTSALDDLNCGRVADLLESQAKETGAALVIVTHDQRLKSRSPYQITL
ncbi:ABC transporter ATP-binding protein YtrE [compost metagenome]